MHDIFNMQDKGIDFGISFLQFESSIFRNYNGVAYLLLRFSGHPEAASLT